MRLWRCAVVAFVASMALQALAQPPGGDLSRTKEPPKGPLPDRDAAPSPIEAIRSWAKALTSKDPADVLKFYAQSDDLIVILSSGHLHKGGAVKTLYEDSSRQIAFFESEVTELTADRMADVAWVTCRHRAKFRVRADDSRFQLEVRTTFVLKRDKDAWRIVLEHSSPIADVPRMKSLQK